jgi:hypothetical protein
MGSDPVDAIRDYFLFTVVGCAIGPEHVAFFSLGDGVIIVNGQAQVLGPYLDNAPPYMTYALLDECNGDRDLRFNLHQHLPTSHLHSFLIGTDGVLDLMREEAHCLPGTDEAVGEITTFWSSGQNYVNSTVLGNRLRLINTNRTRIDWQARRKSTDWGRLPDDTTLIVGRQVTHEA